MANCIEHHASSLNTEQSLCRHKRSGSRDTHNSKNTSSVSSASSRSKYLASSKLTKSGLFQAVRAGKGSDSRGRLE